MKMARLKRATMLALAICTAACSDDSQTQARKRYTHKGVESVAEASRLSGGFSARDRKLYVQALKHIHNLHQRPGQYTIADMLDAEKQREESRDEQRTALVSTALVTAHGASAELAAENARCQRVFEYVDHKLNDAIAQTECRLSGDIYDVTFTIRNDMWRQGDYDQHLRLAQLLWTMGCSKIGVTGSDMDHVHEKLRGEGGEELGGSSWLAGSDISVKGNPGE